MFKRHVIVPYIIPRELLKIIYSQPCTHHENCEGLNRPLTWLIQDKASR